MNNIEQTANELIDNFIQYISDLDQPTFTEKYEQRRNNAKLCAILNCTNIIVELESLAKKFDPGSAAPIILLINQWREVRQYIEQNL